MPKFKCQNKDCKDFDKIDLIPNVTFKWNEETLKLESDHDQCSSCGGLRKTVKDYEGFTEAWFKAESCRNYNNKKIAKFDYDDSVVKNTEFELSKNK